MFGLVCLLLPVLVLSVDLDGEKWEGEESRIQWYRELLVRQNVQKNLLARWGRRYWLLKGRYSLLRQQPYGGRRLLLQRNLNRELRQVYELRRSMWRRVRQTREVIVRSRELFPVLGRMFWSYRYAFAPREVARVGGRSIDVDRQNAAAVAWIRHLQKQGRAIRILIVPGYMPLNAKRGRMIHPRAWYRLQSAVKLFHAMKAHLIVVSGGNVHPSGTPFNEAFGMKQVLMKQLHIPQKHIVLEPFARHSTTNLRNVGRFMYVYGLSNAQAVIVTSTRQSFYFARPVMSTFYLRCLKELGYSVGVLLWKSPTQTLFAPSYRVLRRGIDPLDP